MCIHSHFKEIISIINFSVYRICLQTSKIAVKRLAELR